MDKEPSRYKKSDDYKTLSGHVRYLNRIISKGTLEEQQKAKEELDKLVKTDNPHRDVCIIRRVKNKYGTKYTYIPSKSNIDDDDICVIYKLRSAKD
ncbi:MAG: hypothetical protein ACOCZ5_02210 [bacterium]